MGRLLCCMQKWADADSADRGAGCGAGQRTVRIGRADGRTRSRAVAPGTTAAPAPVVGSPKLRL